MLSFSDYLLAWSLYALASGVLIIAVWRITARFWSWVKDPLRALSAVLLLTPAAVDADGRFHAPAIFVAAFELLTAEGGGIGPLIGVRLLLFSIVAVIGAWLLRLLWYWLVGSRQGRSAAAAAVPAAEPRVTKLRAVDVRDRGQRAAPR